MNELKGQIALVTGGTGGIGRGICEILAEYGATVLVGWHISEGVAQELISRLPNKAARHRALRISVTDTSSLSALSSDLTHSIGRLDILVNCHGVTRFVPAQELNALSDELIDRVLTTHLRGTFATARAFHSLLEASHRGLIVNISSIAADIGIGSNMMYCAAKAGVNCLTRSLALALAPKVRVVGLAPGLIETDATSSFDTSFKAEHIERTPLRRLVTAADIGHSVVALASYMTSVTGVVIPVDAGRSLL